MIQNDVGIRNPVDRQSVYVAVGLVSAGGAILINTLPVLLGAIAVRFALGETQVGELSFAMNIGFAAIGLASLAWVRRVDWRIVATGSALAAAAGLLVLLGRPGYVGVLAGIALAGAGTGGLYSLAMVIFGDSDTAERAFGFKLGLETLPGAALLLAEPALVVPRYGFSGAVVVTALVILGLGILPLPWVPGRGPRRNGPGIDGTGQRPRSTAAFWLAMGSSLVFLIGILAIWAFLAFIGGRARFSANSLGILFSIGFLANAGGGFAASALGFRFGRVVPVIVAVCGEIASLVLIGFHAHPAAFASGVLVFLFSINFVLAYTFGLAAEFENGGALLTLGAVCLALGAAIGPLVAGFLMEGFGTGAAMVFSGLCSVTALVLYHCAAIRDDTLTV